MKTKSKISGHILRSGAYAVLLSLGLIAAGSAFQALNGTEKNPGQPRALTFAERVVYQRAIEDVYWRHRIWPKDNPNSKPSLDAVMSQAQLESKVTGYLRDSLALQDSQKPITAEQLQAEMDRMARDTKQPEVLRELFEALGNDPLVIAECLARPLLADRLLAPSRSEQVKHTSGTYEQLITDTGAYRVPAISDDGGCTDDTWTSVSTANAPSTPRIYHTAVWTGSEMIVWGGDDNGTAFNTGGRYSPSTDSWTATTTVNAPDRRTNHTAVWTGTEMIIWGGIDWYNQEYNSGGRYNPVSDTWTASTTMNAPSTRYLHTAVWTGTEMIVWGGFKSFYPRQEFNSGGRYNPRSDSWTATSINGAPAARAHHTAVWDGTEMIVWGGDFSNTGGRYYPSTDNWAATRIINAPAGREGHTAVWTGSEMIIWGGLRDYNGIGLNTGGRYNPDTNSWTATSTTDAPSRRILHTAVWDGSEMIVWGGNGSTGGRYTPSTNSWTGTSTTNAPTPRSRHTAVWTGSEMIVFGSNAGPSAGGRYCANVSPQLGNISTRAFVQTGDNVVIGGFIVQGAQRKRVIIRAIGPELNQYGVPNALINPTLTLHDQTGALIASNNNWATTIIGGIITDDQTADIRNSGHAPSDGRESAIIADLRAGNYTAIVRGVNNLTGVALVEVYDLSRGNNSILSNISTRSFVQNGDNVMIGGFIVAGTQPKRVIIRALGPELSAPPFNLPDALANPTLELHDSTGALIASNDDWHDTIIGGVITSHQWLDIMNSGHAPGDGRESAIIAELPSANYTAIVRGVNNTTGVALVEVYDLD